MTGRTSRIRKYTLCFLKISIFFLNGDFVENILEKKLIFFLAILTFFMAALDAQRNFMPTRYIFFLSISFGSKVIAFFVKMLPKLNIISVIAID